MRTRLPRSRTLAVYLLKEDVVTPDQALLAPDSLEHREIRLSDTSAGDLFIKPSRPHTPSWLSLFSGAIGDTPELVNTSTAAVLLVRERHRLFAFTFGYGRNLLVPGSWEENFGLHVTLNSIDPSLIRSVDRTTFDTIAQQTQIQASREAPISDFGLDVEQDLLRAVTGTPITEAIGLRLTGKDALHATVRTTLSGIPVLLGSYLQQSQEDTYREHFPWVDHIQQVRDPGIRATLDAELALRLQEHRIDGLWLAAPEPIDWRSVEFRYRDTQRAPSFSDTHLADFLAQLPDQMEITPDFLKRRHVFLVNTETDLSVKHWPVYQCLYAELEQENRSYLLNAGTWYSIQREFMQIVNDSVQSLHQDTFLPPYADIDEPTYNTRIAGLDDVYALMDRNLIRYAGAAGPIEFCDLFSRQRQIIHVKRYGGSSTLSQLFAQGLVSGTLFARDPDFRAHVNAKLPGTHRLPDTVARPSAGEYKVIFGVVSQSPRQLRLPFFSRINLRNTARQLSGMGYTVAITKIPVSPTPS